MTKARVVSASPAGADENVSGNSAIVSTTRSPALNSDIINVGGPGKKSGMYVTCHDGSVLELLQVVPECRNPMSASAWKSGLGKDATIRWIDPSTIATSTAGVAPEGHEVESGKFHRLKVA